MDCGRIFKRKENWIVTGASFGASGLIAYLFYHSPYGMCSFPIVFFLVRRIYRNEKEKRRKKRIHLEFKDYMHDVSGLLLSGNSAERAFLRAQEEVFQLYGRQSVLLEGLFGMEARLSLQEPLERILIDFSKSAGSEDIENFVDIFCYAKRSGGDFVRIIATSVERICDKAEVLEEIQTVLAEKALEQKVMCAAPLGILLFFKLSSPDFIGILYGNFMGVSIMTAALLLYGVSFYLGMKILEVEV